MLRSVANVYILYSFQGKISELKAFVEQQKQSEEKLVIQMSQAVLQKEQELEELKREMRFSMAPTAHDELKELDKCVISREAAATDSALKPAGLVWNSIVQGVV
jgi:hypothetical protein